LSPRWRKKKQWGGREPNQLGGAEWEETRGTLVRAKKKGSNENNLKGSFDPGGAVCKKKKKKTLLKKESGRKEKQPTVRG